MEIRTKFNVGDTVYVVINEKNDIMLPYIVIKKKIDFILTAYNGENLGIRYTHNLYWEGDCFATKEEAQKECERRNGK